MRKLPMNRNIKKTTTRASMTNPSRGIHAQDCVFLFFLTESFARHEAQRTRSSCSVMHSRQKNRLHSGQRAEASRWGW